MPFIPELLAPAGSPEKLRLAVLYGADAVYLSGQKYGLRVASENFTPSEMQEAVEFAHQRGCKVFVTLNAFLHDEDFSTLAQDLAFLEEIGVDALIVSDLGAVDFTRQHCQIDIHLSTQASCLNSASARFWSKMGVKRLVLGREVSIQHAAEIKAESGLEVELFVHGSMCMAYSGHCTISNFTAGRDSNRGGCAHSCRFEYQLGAEHLAEQNKTYMSSKDLNGLELLPQFFKGQIDSLKIEGRMKGPLYAASATRCYRESLDEWARLGRWGEAYQRASEDLAKLSHRDYTQGSLLTPADGQSVFDARDESTDGRGIAGVIIEVRGQTLYVRTRTHFKANDSFYMTPFRGEHKSMNILSIKDLSGSEVEQTHPGRMLAMELADAHLANSARRDMLVQVEGRQ
jgi:putative protease